MTNSGSGTCFRSQIGFGPVEKTSRGGTAPEPSAGRRAAGSDLPNHLTPRPFRNILARTASLALERARSEGVAEG